MRVKNNRPFECFIANRGWVNAMWVGEVDDDEAERLIAEGKLERVDGEPQASAESDEVQSSPRARRVKRHTGALDHASAHERASAA